MEQKVCTKYTYKQGNVCMIKCKNKQSEHLYTSADMVKTCPFCKGSLSEIGYGNYYIN